jgi:purine-nucleoside phosphorylase
MRKAIVKIAAAHHISAVEGIYSALPGPNLETPAEYAMLRNLGSDCTGMSSLPEVLAARHMNLPVLLLSLVVNVAFPPSRIRETTLEEVIQVANEAAPKLRNLITEFLRLP